MGSSIFFCYCHKDEEFRNQLEVHLSALKRQKVIESWHDRKISAGSVLDDAIDRHIDSAEVILLLISPDFIASDYCYDKEVQRALQRHSEGTARVIPIILRPCDWHDLPFGKLLAAPTDGKAITRWTNPDEALLDVVTSIKAALKHLNQPSPGSAPALPATITPNAVVPETFQKQQAKLEEAHLRPQGLGKPSLFSSQNVTEANAPPTLAERVNKFVEWLFEDFEPSVPKGPKVFNDALLGNLLFAKHEVAVIDSPVMQRLRRIKQTGLVYYVFPSATHTRFEHSLGVAALAERCFNAILQRSDVEGTGLVADPHRCNGDLAHLRMAALLHDVGHGLCSHGSEQIYELLSDLQEFKNNPEFVKNSPGEILSYLIVTSPRFSRWFTEYVVQDCQAQLNLKRISELILGKHDDHDKWFLANIISSAYDADKLDYIARDSYYCGLALTVDLPRFLSMISTAKYKGGRVLVLRNYVPLEQILFSKMTLTGSVYQHQKVKCLDSMLRSMVGHIVENPRQAAVPVRGRRITFAEPVQYLYTTDDEFFWQPNGFGDKYIKNMLIRFRNRDLFVRCLEISRRTVKNWDDGRQPLIDLNKLPYRLAEVEDEIQKHLSPAQRACCGKHDIRLSVPGIPSIKTGDALIQTSKGADVENIERYFPLEQWTDAYAHNKWRSFVYAPKEIAPAVRDAAVSVLQKQTGLKMDAGKSNQACHL